ncbi:MULTISPECIES: TetR/AcrR family transcriptional regulator [Nocardiaceae]|uniref:TetR/AcrR family transcriptional regulator n=1 Tax=Nocardiaceae TaxID=85025 RepID=UPI000A4A2D75|nr:MULTISPECIES: TetR/AcrR family transcriptional regulator [Rhodococcus]
MSDRHDVVPILAGVFRDHGFDGSSLAVISRQTGLGKGSLYHYFPRGKQEMAEAVLDDVEQWFHHNVFEPLRHGTDAASTTHDMFEQTARYFRSNRLVCLFGAFTLGLERAAFSGRVATHFAHWIEALTPVLNRLGHGESAAELAEEIVAGIQGALVLSRASDDETRFDRLLSRLEASAARLPAGAHA